MGCDAGRLLSLAQPRDSLRYARSDPIIMSIIMPPNHNPNPNPIIDRSRRLSEVWEYRTIHMCC